MFSISASCFEHSNLLHLANHAPVLKQQNIGVELGADIMPFSDPGLYPKLFPGVAFGMHCPMRDMDIVAPEGTDGERFFWMKYQDSLRMCQSIGATYMVVHALHSLPSRRGGDEAARQLATTRLHQLIELARGYQVDIWIENVGTYLFGSIFYEEKDFLALHKQLPNAHFLMDIGHAHQNGWDAPMICRALGSSLKGLHLHDNFGSHDLHLRIESGNYNFAPLMQALRELHEVNMVLEYLPSSCDDVTAILADIQRLKEMLAG